MTKARRILLYLQGQRAEMIDLLSRLVLAESPSSSPEAQAAPLGILWEALDELGFAVTVLPGRASGGHLLARLGDRGALNGAGQQMLVGHCDTVWPVGTLKEMPLLIEDNIVRGPGVFDMKGGLTQMVFALKCIVALDLDLTVAPLVFVNSDEEIGSSESHSHICSLAKSVRRAFILEPALGLSGKLKTARKGVGPFQCRGSWQIRPCRFRSGKGRQRRFGPLLHNPDLIWLERPAKRRLS